MNEFCPDCGSRFKEARDLAKWWLQLRQCPKACGYFLEVADIRWIYPLQRLEPGVGQKLLNAPEDLIDEAISRIKRIDFKTMSIAFFEHTILGCYRPESEYEVRYRQGI